MYVEGLFPQVEFRASVRLVGFPFGRKVGFELLMTAFADLHELAVRFHQRLEVPATCSVAGS